MKIMLNGETAEIRGATLADALAEHGYADAQVATAVNEEFVPRNARRSERRRPQATNAPMASNHSESPADSTRASRA